MDGILDKVNQVTDFASLMAGSDVMDQVLFSPGFIQYAASTMGISSDDPDLMVKMDAKAKELAQEMVDKGLASDKSAAYDKLMANAAVLYAAKNATDENVMTKQDITNLLKSENATQTILDNLNGTNGATQDPGKALSQAAMAYGLYTAYAHSTGDADLIAKTDKPNEILNGLNDPDFRAWIADPANERDLDGYLASLGMITDSANDLDAASSLMVNGFNDQALKDIFGNALGN